MHGYVHIQGFDGYIAPVKKPRKPSISLNVQEPKITINQGYGGETQRSHLSSKRSTQSVEPHPKLNLKESSKTIKLPSVSAVSSPKAGDREIEFQRSKLWDTNLAHHQRRPRHLAKKSAGIPGKTILKIGLDTVASKSDLSQFELRTPNNFVSKEGLIRGFKSETSLNNLTIQDHIELVKSPKSQINKLKKDTSESEIYRQMLTKKLGIDKLFVQEKSPKKEMYLSTQFFISAPEHKSVNKSPVSHLATENFGSIGSFTEMIGKVNSCLNVGHLSPSMVRKIRSHANLNSPDALIPCSPTASIQTKLEVPVVNIKKFKRGSLKNVKAL